MQTDWDSYYKKPYKTATYSRKITTNVLVDLIKKYTADNNSIRIGELGGANSCFYSDIQERIAPKEYITIDNNQLGLDKFKERLGSQSNVQLLKGDVLNLNQELNLDLVFSVGLIEHFSPEDTKKAINSHFRLVKPNGIVIISYPTPTFLYKITRSLAEMLNLWIFHDERPLSPAETLGSMKDKSEILFQKIIWPIFLTQHIIVARKSPYLS